jgi:hypothetical protein
MGPSCHRLTQPKHPESSYRHAVQERGESRMLDGRRWGRGGSHVFEGEQCHWGRESRWGGGLALRWRESRCWEGTESRSQVESHAIREAVGSRITEGCAHESQ